MQHLVDIFFFLNFELIPSKKLEMKNMAQEKEKTQFSGLELN